MFDKVSDLPTSAGFTLPLVGEDHPLRKNFHRTFALSAVVAMAIHGAIAGGRLRADSFFEKPAEERVYRIMEFYPVPPRLSEEPVSPALSLAERVSTSAKGSFEPVPDNLAEAFNLATVDEMAETAGPDASSLTGGGDSFVMGSDEGTSGGYEAVEVNPVLVHLPRPDYPQIARVAGVEGVVLLQLLIGGDGKVKDVRVLEGPEMLREAAVAAAKQGRFRPAQNQHRPVEAWVQVPMRFSLRK